MKSNIGNSVIEAPERHDKRLWPLFNILLQEVTRYISPPDKREFLQNPPRLGASCPALVCYGGVMQSNSIFACSETFRSNERSISLTLVSFLGYPLPIRSQYRQGVTANSIRLKLFGRRRFQRATGLSFSFIQVENFAAATPKLFVRRRLQKQLEEGERERHGGNKERRTTRSERGNIALWILWRELKVFLPSSAAAGGGYVVHF